jgi:hypothetical protein
MLSEGVDWFLVVQRAIQCGEVRPGRQIINIPLISGAPKLPRKSQMFILVCVWDMLPLLSANFAPFAQKMVMMIIGLCVVVDKVTALHINIGRNSV